MLLNKLQEIRYKRCHRPTSYVVIMGGDTILELLLIICGGFVLIWIGRMCTRRDPPIGSGDETDQSKSESAMPTPRHEFVLVVEPSGSMNIGMKKLAPEKISPEPLDNDEDRDIEQG